jgi:hypothetical protein
MILALCVLLVSADPNVRIGAGVAAGTIQGLGPMVRVHFDELSVDTTAFTYGGEGTWFINAGMHARQRFRFLSWLDFTAGVGVGAFHRTDYSAEDACTFSMCFADTRPSLWLHTGGDVGIEARFVDVVALNLSLPLATTFTITEDAGTRFEGVWPIPVVALVVTAP